MQEGATKTIELPEDKPNLISKTIDCCYTGDYQNEDEKSSSSGSPILIDLRTNFQMYIMLGKFGLAGMENVAFAKIMNDLLEPGWDPWSDSDYESVEVPIAILAVVPLVYNSTPQQQCKLRTAIARFVAGRWTRFRAMDELGNVVAENPDSILDVCDARIKPKDSFHQKRLSHHLRDGEKEMVNRDMCDFD